MLARLAAALAALCLLGSADPPAIAGSALVVALDATPVKFTKAGAVFTIGNAYRTEWVTARTPWLALDRDGTGCIEHEGELFAGFAELAKLDANRDGRIDAKDPAFAKLVLWDDADQDKRCTPNELTRLSAAFERLPLASAPRERPKLGSYEGDTALLSGGARLVDVHLAALP
jgi:hypothetical protein